MAGNISRINIFLRNANRGYGTAAPQSLACGGHLNTSKLPNEATVISIGCKPKGLVKVAVAFKAGSRYERGDNQGVSHLLRSSAGLTTGSASAFSIQRNLQQIGANLTTIQDRETLVYVLESTSDHISPALEFLKQAITKQEFRPWELADSLPRVLNELAILPPQAKVFDLLHKAAFREGLGNSLYVKPHNIKTIGSETLQHFATSQLVGANAGIVGCGLDHSHLAEFAESLHLSSGGGAGGESSSKVYAGEERQDESQPLLHVAIAGQAPSLSSGDEAIASAVGKFALGGGSPAVKYGTGSSPLSKLASDSAAISAFSIAHSDAGLFGVYVAAKPSHAKKAVEDAVKALKTNVTDADVERGKAQLKTAILFSADSCQGLVEDLSAQSLLSQSPKSPSELADAVDRVSTQQVKQVIEKAVTGQKALAALGNTSYAPYLDQL